jgi:hypothetical protein
VVAHRHAPRAEEKRARLISSTASRASGTAQVTDRSGVQLIVMIVVMLLAPRLVRRFVPT